MQLFNRTGTACDDIGNIIYCDIRKKQKDASGREGACYNSDGVKLCCTDVYLFGPFFIFLPVWTSDSHPTLEWDK